MKNFKLKKDNFISFTIFSVFIPIIVFGRSFMGVNLLGFRFGELLVAFGLFFSIFIFFYKNFFESFLGKKATLSIILIFISTYISILFRNNLDLNFYNFKSSSYIWLLSYILLALIFNKYILINLNFLFILNISLFFTYFISVIYYPKVFINFFTSYSDKFDYLKASDILIVFILTNILNNRYLTDKFSNTFEYFIILSSIFFPLFIYKSRGAALAFSIYFILEIYNFRNLFKFKFIKVLSLIVICLILFYISVFLITDQQIEYDEVILNSDLLETILDNKNTSIDSLFSIYIITDIDELKSFELLDNGRLFSTDGNINFRLQIWQDVLIDSFENLRFLIGVGYNEKIPAMLNPLYVGTDGTNEYVHNYFVNIYARGGLIQLVLFLYFFISIIKPSNIKIKKNMLFTFIFPNLVVSFFDSSMSSAQFPTIFFFFIGCALVKIEEEVNIKKEN